MPDYPPREIRGSPLDDVLQQITNEVYELRDMVERERVYKPSKFKGQNASADFDANDLPHYGDYGVRADTLELQMNIDGAVRVFGAGAEGVTDHGNLAGLGDDDHNQYLLVSGSRAMGGALDMGSYAITNVGNVDGLDVSSHDHGAAGGVTVSHDDLDGVSADDHHTAFIGLEDNAGTAINPAGDNRIQVTDDGIINADASGSVLALTFDQASIDHGGISGLGDDDHTHYLLADGTRAMSGNLDMGGNAIVTVGNVDGIDVSAHNHGPSGGATVNHSYLGSVSADQHHAAFIGLEDGTASAISPDTDDRIQIAGTGAISTSQNNHILEINLDQTSIDHGNLAGLGDDDHTHYLLADGTRAMGGDLDMGSHAITNVGDVDGLDISAHDHGPNGGATVSHDDLDGVSEDDHHAAFVGLEDNAGTAINPAGDNRIQVTDDSVINADAGTNTLDLSIAQGQIDHGNLAGLGDDDHTQYTEHGTAETITGSWTFETDITLGDGSSSDVTLTFDDGVARTLAWDDSAGQFALSEALSLSGHLLPDTTDTYDIGSSTLLWRRGWLSELDTVLFVENTIQVTGGWQMIPHSSGTLNAALTASTSDTTIDPSGGLAVDDFLLLRDSLAVEYMQVTADNGDGTYEVTRDVDGSGVNAWPSGHVYVNLGYTGDGRIEFDAQNATGSPRMSIYEQGSSYNATTERVRLGNLNGWGPYSSEIYGAALGDSSGDHLRWDPSNGLELTGKVTAASGEIGGWTVTSTQLEGPNRQVILDAANSNVHVYNASGGVQWVFLGKTYTGGAYTGDYGISAVDDDYNFLFRIDTSVQQIAGWTFSFTEFSNTDIWLDAADKQIAIQSQTFGNAGIQFEYNSGSPRAYIGDGSNAYLNYDGTKLTWKAANTELDGSGNLTATSATLSGSVTASSGTIGGWTLTATELHNTDIWLDAADKQIAIESQTFGAAGIQLEYDGTSGRAYIGDGSNEYLQYDGTNISWGGANSSLDTSGNIHLSGGDIGGWTITGDQLYAGTNTPGGGSFTGLVLDATGITYDAEDWNLAGVESGTLQVGVKIDDGKLYAGAGSVMLDDHGVKLKAGQEDINSLKWGDLTDLSSVGSIYGYTANGTNILFLQAYNTFGDSSSIKISSDDAESVEIYVKGGLKGDFKETLIDLMDDVAVGGSLDVFLGIEAANIEISNYGTFEGGIHVGGTSDPGTDNAIIDGDERIGGGLYVGGTGTDPDADDIHYDGNLKSVKSATAYDVYGFHPLTTPLTHTSFDGDSFSDVGSSTKIENTSWSTTIPADAKALLLEISIKDSASANNHVYFAAGPTSTYWYALAGRASGAPNDEYMGQVGPVTCSDGDIYYRCQASGTDTLDVTLRVWGYWI